MMYKPVFPLALLLLLSQVAGAQRHFPFTTATARQQHDLRLKDTVIYAALQQPLTPATERQWQGAFWGMELALLRNGFLEGKLAQAWQDAGARSEGFQKALLEASYTLYPVAFNKPVLQLLKTTPSPGVAVRCAEYLLLSNDAANRRAVKQALVSRVPSSDFLGYRLLQQRLEASSAAKAPLRDLFAKSFLPGQTVIYSLQRHNRNYPGMVVIRRPDGQFVKAANGNFFHVAQLARAITNYPFYITNGNTPQGIFRWTGFDTSTSNYIGPTPNLQLLLPFETSPAVFLGDSTQRDGTWTKEQYTALLPASLKNFEALYQSFWAGAIGRSEIIMHGTAINTAYYKGQPYYPQTPSMGCLCSYEEWDSNGNLRQSNQQAIVDALRSLGASSGYVVVIELDDRQQPVGLADVQRYLR